jgi:hypothetical protein
MALVLEKSLIISHSSRAVKMNLANEGLEARKKDEEVTARKRKAEEDKQWEGVFLAPRFCTIRRPPRCRDSRATRRQLAEFLEHQEKEKDQDCHSRITSLLRIVFLRLIHNYVYTEIEH